MEAAAGVVRLAATPGGVVYPGVAYGEGATQDGLFVGPAIGRVGELVRERVTVKLCPSQPLVASLSANDMLVSLSYTIPLGGLRTKSTPGFLFIFHDDLAQSRGKAMLVIIHHSLSNV